MSETNGTERKATSERMSGLSSRLAAARMVTLVVDKQASMEDLTDPEKGLSAFLQLEDRDQGLARAIALTTLRHKRQIETALGQCWKRKPPQKARFLIHMLETAAAQILFMNVPDSAAVNLAISAVRRERSTTRFSGFANAVLRKLAANKAQLLADTSRVSAFSPYLEKAITRDFGKEKLHAMSRIIRCEPVLDLRFKPDAKLRLDETLPLPSRPHSPAARLLTETPVQDLHGYHEGEWWVQDIAAGQPALLFGNVKGRQIADLCAAPGGKTMQLASMGAEVTSVDISRTRLKRLEENLARTGLTAELICEDILKWEPSKRFDGILLDAPCSATGTIRRHPDILWNTTPELVASLAELQKALIEHVAALLKPGGILIYANCSLLKEEGENLLAGLNLPTLKHDPVKTEELPGLEFCINGRGQFRSLPHHLELHPEDKSGMDGFFAARFIKCADEQNSLTAGV